MGWIHAGTGGKVGTAHRLGLRATERAQTEADRRAAAAAEAEQLRAERLANQEAEYQRILQVAVTEAREGDWANEPKEEPTDEEIASLLKWFGTREDGMAFLQDFLSTRGWNTLEDLWEMREALIIAQSAFLS